jgi:hypothetical protein
MLYICPMNTTQLEKSYQIDNGDLTYLFEVEIEITHYPATYDVPGIDEMKYSITSVEVYDGDGEVNIKPSEEVLDQLTILIDESL